MGPLFPKVSSFDALRRATSVRQSKKQGSRCRVLAHTGGEERPDQQKSENDKGPCDGRAESAISPAAQGTPDRYERRRTRASAEEAAKRGMLWDGEIVKRGREGSKETSER